MQVSLVMTRNVQCTTPNTTLKEAAQKMSSLDVGPLPVCDDGRLVGMLTDRDITVRATAQGLDPNVSCVCDVMTPDVVYCFQDQEISEAASLMKDKQIRRIVVLDR